MALHELTVKIVATLLFLAVHQSSARQIRQAQETSTLKSLVNLSVEELVFIIKSRHGEMPKQPKQITPCARAILSCCNDKKINEYCSESLKCGAHFFDDNPCDDKFLFDAMKNARYFYEQFTPTNTLAESES